MRSYLRPSTHPPNLLPYPLCRTQESRAAPPLPPPSPCKEPHGPIPLALAPPPVRLPIAPFSTPAAPDDPLSPSSAVAPSSDSPNAETSRITSCAKPPHSASYSTTPPPPLSSETASPNLPLLLLRPYLWSHSLTCASLPPLYPQPHTTSLTATHMR